MKILASERERWVLFQLINPIGQTDRADGRRVDRLWNALELDTIEYKHRSLKKEERAEPDPYDPVNMREHELTAEQVDFLLELLNKPGLTRSGRAWLRAIEAQLEKAKAPTE